MLCTLERIRFWKNDKFAKGHCYKFIFFLVKKYVNVLFQKKEKNVKVFLCYYVIFVSSICTYSCAIK